MHEQDDNALLQEYALRGSEEAFAAIVHRHVNKVYSTAWRHVQNPHQAEEITQAVFVLLAQKAAGLNKKVILSGWLYNTARLTAVTFVRGEIRRARREKEAHLESQSQSQDTDARIWSDIAPLLDDAISRLNENDRHAIVLRYLDGKSASEVGARLGLGEAAAKMRVSRALEKLRVFFAKRGIAHSGAALAATISAHSVHACPPALAATIAAGACAGGATTGGTATIVKGVLTAMAWTKLKTATVAIIVVGSVVTPILVQHNAKARIAAAEANLESLRAQIASLEADRDRLARLAKNAGASQKQMADLVRLRKETSALREQAKELPKLKEENHSLQATLRQPRPATEEEMKANAVAKMSTSRQLLLAFFMYSGDHNGQFPTNFEQAGTYMQDSGKTPADAADQFQIAFQGSTSEIQKPAEVIVLQENDAWNYTIDGEERWAKAYAFADGHAEIHVQQGDDFSAFEQQHSPNPPPTSP